MSNDQTAKGKMKVLLTTSAGLTDAQWAKIENASPQITVAPFSYRGDSERQLEAKLADAEIIVGGLPRRYFHLAPMVRWVHNLGAGADGFMYPELLGSEVKLTTSKGAHAIPIAEHVITFMLMLQRKMATLLRWQREGHNPPRRVWLEELYGKTVGILGVGNVGREVARKTKAGFGMRTLGLKRTPVESIPYVDEVMLLDGLHDLLRQSDFVVITMPGTPETHGLIGEEELRLMKSGAFLINVGRGRIVENEWLIKALEEGWIAGAGLDANAPEPVPVDSPLRQMENVIVTPHHAGLTQQTRSRGVDYFCENLQRYLAGQSLSVQNAVDREAGY